MKSSKVSLIKRQYREKQAVPSLLGITLGRESIWEIFINMYFAVIDPNTIVTGSKLIPHSSFP